MNTVTKRITWFKNTFHSQLEGAVEGSPFSIDLLCAIAYQETGYIWGRLFEKMSVSDVLKNCVGDTLDTPSRSAFPTNKAALLKAHCGQEMFDIAHEGLVEMSQHVPGYAGVAKKSTKFCHGFGIFQYDIQFFLKDPEYFLQKKWYVFDVCVSNCVRELFEAKVRQGWKSKTSLTRRDLVFVAIAYNKGRATISKGFKQGHKSDDGKYYGENIDEYMKIATSIEVAPSRNPVPLNPVVTPIDNGKTPGVTSDIFRVDVKTSLNLRDAPRSGGQKLGQLPPGQIVQRLSGTDSDSWWEIEASLDNKTLRGFIAAKYVKATTTSATITTEEIVTVDFDKVPRYISTEIKQTDKVIESGEKGKRVKRVQEWLCHHGIRTSIDEDFGPATVKCVKIFQKRNSITESGKVNPTTWKALVAPMTAALTAPKNISKMSPAEAIRAVAEQHVAVHPHEIGGANRGPWVRLYCEGNDGAPWAWCAGFVSLIMHQAYFYLGKTPPIAGSVSCDVLASQAKEAKMFVYESSLSSGKLDWKDLGPAAIFLRRRTSTDWTHTGFAMEGEGATFDTIEGNTNDEGSREGFEACKRVRSIAGGNYDFINFS